MATLRTATNHHPPHSVQPISAQCCALIGQSANALRTCDGHVITAQLGIA